jgi:uncharacterized protein YbcI
MVETLSIYVTVEDQGETLPQHPPIADAVRASERGPQSAVCAGISALVRERWGRGPSRSRAYFAGPDALVVLLDDAHTDAERTLIEHGHGAEVLAGRRTLGELAKADLSQIAECATGRPVRAVLSESCLDPAFTTHVFVFGVETRGTADQQLGDAVRRALDQTSSARALLAESEQLARHSVERRAKRASDRDARPRDD